MRTITTLPELVSDLPHAGETIGGKYRVDGAYRQEGTAIVLDATRVACGERVAVEVLRPEWSSHASVAERFLREGEATMRIRSEHAVRVLDEGLLDDATPYLVVEQVDGQNLEAIVARWGCLPVTTAVDCLLQAMEAIAQAHSFGVVHGDLNVSKMFVTRRPDRSWCVKVDYTQRKVARPSQSGEFPVAERPTVRGDVRALGGVLHVLLAGAAPCGGVVHPSVPRALGEVVRRSLQAGPRGGYASVSQLARVLAPFGTAAARVSCERIECLLDDRVSELTRPPRHPIAPVVPSAPLELDVDPRAFGMPASGRVVFPALAMLAALGAIVFAALYMSVPRSDAAAARAAAHATGVAEMQGR